MLVEELCAVVDLVVDYAEHVLVGVVLSNILVGVLLDFGHCCGLVSGGGYTRDNDGRSVEDVERFDSKLVRWYSIPSRIGKCQCRTVGEPEWVMEKR